MRPLQLEPTLSVHLINEGFARAIRVLTGKLRRADLAAALGCTADREIRECSVALGERIWSETARAFLASPLRRHAVEGHLDGCVGYAHLLPVLEEQGVSVRNQELRESLALLSNEICSLLGRLLVVAASGADQAFAEGLEHAKASYLRSFEANAVKRDPSIHFSGAKTQSLPEMSEDSDPPPP